MSTERRKREGVMLCYPFEVARLNGKIRGSRAYTERVFVQPKLDGERCRALWNPEERLVKLLSSTGELITSVPHINKQLETWFGAVEKLPEIVELDGELYRHGWKFEQIHSVVSREYDSTRHPDFEQIQFHVFDIVIDRWKQSSRLYMLDALCRHVKKEHAISTGAIQQVETLEVERDADQIVKHYEFFINLGYEGIVVRDMVSPYIRKRNRFVMKFKVRNTDIYQIYNIYPAVAKNGDLLDMVGSFTVIDDDGLMFEVGAGCLTHTQRREILANKKSYFNRKLKCSYQGHTEGGVPRFGLVVEII